MIIVAALLAILLAALDALIVATAMPTIVADLGGLELYSWVFSAYMLMRTIALPLFGKLSDLYSSKKLFVLTMGTFMATSALAGVVSSMPQLIVLRAVQGLGAGGVLALAYVAITEAAPPEKRSRMLGLTGVVWGVASVSGPVLGGLIVTYLSWQWVFYINLPVGAAAILGIVLFLQEARPKKQVVSVDYPGALALAGSVLAFLSAVVLLGEGYDTHAQNAGLLLLAAGGMAVLFGWIEHRAQEPILHLRYFRSPRFVLGNGASFFSAFAIFSCIAYIPLFVQSALGKSPAEVSMAMIPLSLGWSLGGILCGHVVSRTGKRAACLGGSLLIAAAIGITLTFDTGTDLIFGCVVFGCIGLGMGFVNLSTLLIVQDSLDAGNLGIATSSQQFAGNLGGTVGVGIAGAIMTFRMKQALAGLGPDVALDGIALEGGANVSHGLRHALTQAADSALTPETIEQVRAAAANGVEGVFLSAFIGGAICIGLSAALFLSARRRGPRSERALASSAATQN
jgi:EmrB/QacA subfamily drug resistance transporter